MVEGTRLHGQRSAPVATPSGLAADRVLLPADERALGAVRMRFSVAVGPMQQVPSVPPAAFWRVRSGRFRGGLPSNMRD
jgi:hypothetical protein